jgi:hypothetical protein
VNCAILRGTSHGAQYQHAKTFLEHVKLLFPFAPRPLSIPALGRAEREHVSIGSCFVEGSRVARPREQAVAMGPDMTEPYLDILPAERVAVARGKIPERHPKGATDPICEKICDADNDNKCVRPG